VGVLTLMMIDGVESLATAQAIDRIDPFKRKSDPDKVLMAMGLSNMVSSLLGGLTVIPGGVKSKTCIEAGGRTLWANFANALFLLGFLFVAPALVSLLPKATLGAILVYTGWKMIHPSIARHLAAVGWEQVLVYFITIVVTLLTDILVGVLAGTLAKLIFLVPLSWMGHKALRDGTTLWGSARELFQDPVKEEITQEGKVTLRVHKPVVCFNAYKLSARLDKLQAEGKQACVEFLPSATVIDHTSREALHRMEDNNPAALVVTGVEKLYSLSAHHQAVRVRFQLSE
jgi:MFS superfamily sulfate permease-like transporter